MGGSSKRSILALIHLCCAFHELEESGHPSMEFGRSKQESFLRSICFLAFAPCEMRTVGSEMRGTPCAELHFVRTPCLAKDGKEGAPTKTAPRRSLREEEENRWSIATISRDCFSFTSNLGSRKRFHARFETMDANTCVLSLSLSCDEPGRRASWRRLPPLKGSRNKLLSRPTFRSMPSILLFLREERYGSCSKGRRSRCA